ncbi:MAG: PAS domain S-box protein [Nitrospinae bacterium]|nr:PAS domain S-box protein [Nitrospinota bacterium]
MKKTKESASEMSIHSKILLDTITDIVYFKDREGRNLAVNKAFEEFVGLKKAEIIGKTDEQLFPPDLAERCNFSDREVFKKGRALDFEEECIGKDGKRRFFNTIKSPVYDRHRNIIGLVGVSRNITEYRQTLEDLQLFKSIINQTNDAVAIVDPETSRFIYVNDKLCSNLGYTRKEMFNMRVTDIEAILPDNFSWDKHVSEVREKGYMLLEGLHKRKDGTTFPVWVNVKFMNIMENDYMVAIARDITEWKKMQDEMQRLNQGLEQRVIERTEQLETVNIQLKEEFEKHKKAEEELERMRNIESIGTLAGGIAHDFNNLLTAILGNIYLSKLYLSKKNLPSDDEVFKKLTQSEDICMQAKELTGMLITFARGGEPVKELITMSEMLKETVSLVIPSNLKIICEFDIPAHLYPVKADKLQVKQVVRSIVANAVEAMPNGGVIKVRAENLTVSQSENLPLKDGRYLKVSISDNGVGIPVENLLKVFDPYFSTKGRGAQKGMGLGLSICHSIIKRHEGLITVDSKVGVGTTFHFYLPTYEKQN